MYIGLLNGSHEPDSSTGYARVKGELSQVLAFDADKGYGMITHIALFDAAEGGKPLKTIELPEPVDCHDGVIPLVHNGKLLRGLDVTAHVTLKTAVNAVRV